MSDITFEEFPKIPRLFRDVVVTEKIDGTNAQIIISEDKSVVAAASRNRLITPGKSTDNHGFAQFVADNAEMFQRFGPGQHFGEWWGTGVNARYKHAFSKQFFSFEWWRFAQPDDRPVPYAFVDEYRDKQEPIIPGTNVVPVLYHGVLDFYELHNLLDKYKNEGSVVSPGDPMEGFVIYHKMSKQSFKVTFDGDGHKEAKKGN